MGGGRRACVINSVSARAAGGARRPARLVPPPAQQTVSRRPAKCVTSPFSTNGVSVRVLSCPRTGP